MNWSPYLVVIAVLLACGGTDAPGEDVSGSPDGMTGHDMASHSPVDTYVAGLEKSGVNGLVHVRLMESTPIPEYTDLYTWTVEVVDLDGEPITGATVVAEPRMPGHGHGTFPPFTDAVEIGGGSYQLVDMDLFMPGVWQVTIRITTADGDDEVAYDFDLEG
ncbi:MAG: hypothetical protein CMH54_01400 [Myxococcales bacterium]|nr:hypothetical protein [Myxococcales bacterium]